MELEERETQKRKQDREDARVAAEGAMAYLASLRDSVIDLKDHYRAKYGDRSYSSMVRGDFGKARRDSVAEYAGVGLLRGGPGRAAKPWLDSESDAESTDEEMEAFMRGRAPAPAPVAAPEPELPPPRKKRRPARPPLRSSNLW